MPSHCPVQSRVRSPHHTWRRLAGRSRLRAQPTLSAHRVFGCRSEAALEAQALLRNGLVLRWLMSYSWLGIDTGIHLNGKQRPQSFRRRINECSTLWCIHRSQSQVQTGHAFWGVAFVWLPREGQMPRLVASAWTISPLGRWRSPCLAGMFITLTVFTSGWIASHSVLFAESQYDGSSIRVGRFERAPASQRTPPSLAPSPTYVMRIHVDLGLETL
mmetsp:Transcript_6276/g.13986  ORF Transcript_6276/g.13986 Transcript_6276/m.13986 type:complete len:216 (+) Transcript_6276:3-650(+)